MYFVLKIVAGVLYAVGFLICCCILAGSGNTTSLRDKPWIPARFRGDACLRPLFLVLPAFFWPLVLALYLMFLFLKGLFYLVWHLIGSATTCCGIPLPEWWTRIVGDGPAAASSEADLEMGSVVPSTEDEGDDEPDGGKDDTYPVGVRSTGYGESERPPSYTSLRLHRDEDDDDSGEADGLLDKSTEGGREMIGQ